MRGAPGSTAALWTRESPPSCTGARAHFPRAAPPPARAPAAALRLAATAGQGPVGCWFLHQRLCSCAFVQRPSRSMLCGRSRAPGLLCCCLLQKSELELAGLRPAHGACARRPAVRRFRYAQARALRGVLRRCHVNHSLDCCLLQSHRRWVLHRRLLAALRRRRCCRALQQRDRAPR
jgi:hypothetical protein